MTALSFVRTYSGYGLAAARTRAASFRARPWSRIWYVVEPRDWSVNRDGKHLSAHVSAHGVDMRTTTVPAGVKSQVVHYGSRSPFLLSRKLRCDESNRVVFTWFHGSEQDSSPANRRMIELLPEASERAEIVVTSSFTARDRLLRWGVPDEKVRVIPLGVDTRAFRAARDGERERLRERLGIPLDALCVGSFHKDGEGWCEGDRPKYEKAPEVLVETLAQLARAVQPKQVHVLLTGPARGYVKSGLDRAGVPYTHTVIPDFRLMPPLYRALDLYLVPSRDEGGPKGLLEAMASGVPVVSTKVGMAVDIVEHGLNGVLAGVEDVAGLVSGLRWLSEDRAAHQRVAINGRNVAERHDWSLIARRYADELYLPLLGGGGDRRSGQPETETGRGSRAA